MPFLFKVYVENIYFVIQGWNRLKCASNYSIENIVFREESTWRLRS